MPDTTTRSRENTRARLVEAASVVFAEAGVEGASVEAICERAGFTRGAFYSNFGSKAELLFALVQQLAVEKVARIGVRVREMMDVDGPDRLGPAEIVAQIREIAAENRETVVLMNELRVQAMRDAELARAYLALEDAMNERIAEIVSDIVRIHGLRLRVSPLEAARLLQMNWNGTAALAAIAGLDDAAAQQLLSERTAVLAAALADGADGV